MKALSVRNLSKTYPNGVRALDRVSFEVEQGEFVAVVGLSGSGKTSLLKCISHLIEPDSGEIKFGSPGDRKKTAMIFQGYNLIPRHSVLTNTLMGALSDTPTLKSVFGMFSKNQIAQAAEYLRLMAVDDKINFRASQLSGGQQQRVAIARALMQKPEIILADEPVASLDPSTAHLVMKYLKFVNQKFGVTIICNLHFLSLVRDYATSALGLNNGTVVFRGTPSEMTDSVYRKIYGADPETRILDIV